MPPNYPGILTDPLYQHASAVCSPLEVKQGEVTCHLMYADFS
jgi:hypothetical protein